MDKNIGKKLDGRYEIVELIGVGGMADVYKANDIVDSKVVAVKILKKEFSENEEFLRRFRNESKAIAVLSHPNIVKVLDVGFTNKIQFIVMEYIEGITLKEYMEKEQRLNWKDAAYFMIQILRALQHAHDRGIVHRDIKPQNIMMLTDGTIKVMDFGIAKFAREEGLTTTAQAIGSVHYISPEQARSDVTDEKSDIYSVGIVLYEMLTGVKPFDTDNPVSVALMHMQTKAKNPREVNPDIPIGLEEIILKAIEKEPCNRYLTAALMINDIEKFKSSPDMVFGYYEEENESDMDNDNKNSESNTKFFKPLNAPSDMNIKKKGTQTVELQDTDEDYNIEEEYIEKRSMFVPILSGVAIVVVIVAVCFIVGLLYNYFGGAASDNKEFVLDNFVGYDYDYVKKTYGNLLIITKDDNKTEYSMYPKGQIISQEPEAGKTVKPGSEVKVIISAGPKMVEVDAIDTGFKADKATALLVEKGFNVQQKYKYSESVEAEHVISTVPEAGTALEEGSTVILYVSLGPVVTQVTIPDLTGKKEEEAKQILENLDLVVLIQRINSERLEGTVASQSHSPNKKINTREEVTLFISTGQPPTQTISIDIPIPPNASGLFTIRAYIDGSLAVEEKDINPQFTTKKTITLTSSGGRKEVTITVLNQSNNKEKQIVKYNLNFDETMKKAITYDDIPGGFEAVDGIKAVVVTTQAVTSPTTTSAAITASNGETGPDHTPAQTTSAAGE